MKPALVVENARVFLGDCREVLKTLPDNSVDSVVTDPPYELGFMGKKWDSSGIAYDVTVWEECLRVLKPGGHILAFGGTRTWHRLAVAIEDAGFEIRDNIAWMYGSGFPKSKNVALAIDKGEGHPNRGRAIPTASSYQATDTNQENKLTSNKVEPYEARSKLAQKWQGWGTALKPAFEPVVVGRKPVEGTVANNVLAWGVGGLNIDGSRIANVSEKEKNWTPQRRQVVEENGWKAYNSQQVGQENPMYNPSGRWPANVILDEVTAGLLDEQSGVSVSTNRTGKRTGKEAGTFGTFEGQENVQMGHNDSGGASRFFYVAKASKRDRNEGLEELPQFNRYKKGGVGGTGGKRDVSEAENATPVSNFHPTVKPTQLMGYLIKLVTPEGGIVLDPFTGSGSTGKAALLDGFEFIGAELTEDYLPIIEGRLKWAVENRAEESLF